jgi:hypothetical protein
MANNMDKKIEEKIPGTGKTGDQDRKEVQGSGYDRNMGNMPSQSEGSGHKPAPGSKHGKG